MKTLHLTVAVCGLLVASSAGGPAWADVLNMGGTRNPATGQWTGLASLETVPVGDAGNTGELSGSGAGGFGPDRICGAVDYTYNIGKYEVTAGQYAEFLNKVAGVDAYGLYDTRMWLENYGCKIERFAGNGTTGSPYQYRVAADYENRPVNCVSWGDAARFANWLHNGQPTGTQNVSTTEDGAYFLNGAVTNTALLAVNRKSNARWAIANEDEWYKAAYYNPATGSYYDYPTSSNSVPGRDLNDGSGNNANYYLNWYMIGSPYYRTPKGAFKLSKAPYGTFDQGGNVWEWNEAVVDSSSRGVRGGSFDSLGFNLQSSFRLYGNPASLGFGLGFRVVQVPVPGDVNGDSQVDVVDLLCLVDAFGCMTGDTNYDTRCDFNHDGTVDVVDLLDVVYNFGT